MFGMGSGVKDGGRPGTDRRAARTAKPDSLSSSRGRGRRLLPGADDAGLAFVILILLAFLTVSLLFFGAGWIRVELALVSPIIS